MADEAILTYQWDDEPDEHSVPVISRREHIREFAANYHAGQHVTFLGPSGRGKTKLCGQLLVATLRRHPEMEGRVLHGKIKGRDQTIEKLSKEGFPITRNAFPSRLEKMRYDLTKPKGQRRLGFIVRPLIRPEGDIHNDNARDEPTEKENLHLRRVFRKVIYKGYHAKKKKPVITVVDEAHQAHNDLKLRKACEGPLMRGRPVCAMWSLLQRGRYVSYMVYDQAEHVYIFADPDKANQERYSEIGGVDAVFLKRLSKSLKTYTASDGSTYSQCIYFRRSGDYLAIVDV